jgi:hypothetical protein
MPVAQIKPADYAILPIAGAAGKLISIGEWLDGDGFGTYDHAEIFVGGADANAPLGYTMGAYPGGATLVPVPANQEGWLWSSGHISLTDDERAKICSLALACKGIPYSSLDYFALAAHRLHIPAPYLKSYVASSKHLICSQLVDLCYCDAGVHLFNDGRWPGYVTPADLANLILKDVGITL